MLDLDDDWVWDFWTVDDGAAYHMFFLHAPRRLGDPELRHTNARVGHAVSPDLTSWTVVEGALAPSETGFDDLATWTGSVVPHPDGGWLMLTSGVSRAEHGRVQRIGASWSADLFSWERRPLLLEADERWYHLAVPDRAHVHWRDPWVVRDAREGRWHLYVTAQVPGEGGHGVVGHATSTDLVHWEVGPPLGEASGRFDQLEVISVQQVEGRWVLLFSCLAGEMPGAPPGAGGVWSVPVTGPGEPVDVPAAVRLTGEELYVGKVVAPREGGVRFLAFVNRDSGGRFVGGVTDPIEVGWRRDGAGLELRGAPDDWLPDEAPGTM